MTKTTTLRVPDDLYAEVEQMAEQDDRSINGELVNLIRRGVKAQRDDADEIIKWMEHTHSDKTPEWRRVLLLRISHYVEHGGDMAGAPDLPSA